MHQDDLRSGKSFWRVTGPPAIAYPALDEDVRCDVVVVGGGITGSLLAWKLSREGVAVVLLDREEVGAGSTAASTGLLQYEIDTPLIKLISYVGADVAVQAYRLGIRAIDNLEEVSELLPQSCDFFRRPTLYLASDEHDFHELKKEHECRRHFGFDVRLLEKADLKTFCGIDRSGALWSLRDAEINPYRFTLGVLQLAAEQGARLCGGTAVTSAEEHADSVVVTTKSGRVTARHALFATGYSQDFLPKPVGSLHTTYALATEPIASPSNWPEKCLIWETARPYFYARTTADGRVVMGGADTDGRDDHEDPGIISKKTERLRAQFASLFPETTTVTHCSWAGTFAETQDGLPYIGPLPGRQRICFALGYGGNGITFSMLAAQLLTDYCVGRPNPNAAIFRFGR